MVCQLCLRAPAEQTGSHIVSSFLLTSQIGARGQEKAYLITENPSQDYGKNQGDAGIKEDHLFCRDCEKRLGYIEDYYSREITHKIEQPQFSPNFTRHATKHGEFVRCLRIDPIAFTLLIYSVIWRAGLSTQELYNHFKLPKEVMESLRFHLDLFLPEAVDHKVTLKLSTWLNSLRACSSLFKFYPYLILKAENLQNKEITVQYFSDRAFKPNEIILNEYVILPFFAAPEWKDDFFGLKKELNSADLINHQYEEIKIGILTNGRFEQIIDLLRQVLSANRLRSTIEFCIEELKRRKVYYTLNDVRRCVALKINSIKV